VYVTNLSTTQVYISVFLSRIKTNRAPPLERDEDWPYDRGDDPSFKAAKELRGPLMWGVCRPNIRNKLHEGDIVVFFSCRKSNQNGNSTYRLCAICTVKRKVKQTDIGRLESLRQFERYSNLLIRPLSGAKGWEHYEPPSKGPRGHSDWLWRIAERAGFKKKDFQRVERTHMFDSQTMILGRTIKIAPNYMIFSSSSSETYVLANPPIVANFVGDQTHEYWRGDRLSRSIMKLTLCHARQVTNRSRWLRIGTPRHPYPHPPISFGMSSKDARDWREEFIGLVGNK
jgi:hypothetical protein